MQHLSRRACALLGLALYTSAWAQPATDMPPADLAPTGTLRAVINLGNPILARKDAQGEPVGVSVDLARALAVQLKLPLKLIPVDSAGKSVELVTQDKADVGFFAIDPVRGQGIAFTSAYVQIEGSYLVRQNSPLQSNSEVDRAAHRVVVGKGSAYDLFLTRELKQAQLVRAPTSPEVVSFFMGGNYDVAAGVKQQLESDARQTPGVRLLPGRFMVIDQAMGLPKTRSAAAHQLLGRFVSDMKSSGFVATALQRHQIEGAVVAP
jgi:polar amino acid transport system substrate-binding protein